VTKSTSESRNLRAGGIDGMLSAPEPEIPPWTFLTNHAHVLIVISRRPDARQRDIAFAVGLTVGAVQRIIRELEEADYLVSERIGRRNRYRILDGKSLRHPLESHHTLRELMACVAE